MKREPGPINLGIILAWFAVGLVLGSVLMMALTVVANAATPPPLSPDPALTPGWINPTSTLALLCVPGYTAHKGIRHVTLTEKAKVYAAYHIDPRQGGPYEIDHLISLELGGSNDPRNLWPQSYVTKPVNAHIKDALEDHLHALVCRGKVPLSQAQSDLAADWRLAFVKYMSMSTTP
jgi:hypothetical protein